MQCGLNSIVKMATAACIGDHLELIALPVLKEMRALTTSALGATLVAGPLAHEKAMLRRHDFLISGNGNAERNGGLIAKLFNLLE